MVQVNELFADQASLRDPVWIPREVLQVQAAKEDGATQAVVVYTGISAPSICRGMDTAEVSRLFSVCKICIRAFDFKTGTSSARSGSL